MIRRVRQPFGLSLLKEEFVTSIKRQDEVCRTFLSVLIALPISLWFGHEPAQSQSQFHVKSHRGTEIRTMIKPTEEKVSEQPALFYDVLAKSLKKRKTSLEKICPQTDKVARRIL